MLAVRSGHATQACSRADSMHTLCWPCIQCTASKLCVFLKVVQNSSFPELGGLTTSMAWACVTCASAGLVLLYRSAPPLLSPFPSAPCKITQNPLPPEDSKWSPWRESIFSLCCTLIQNQHGVDQGLACPNNPQWLSDCQYILGINILLTRYYRIVSSATYDLRLVPCSIPRMISSFSTAASNFKCRQSSSSSWNPRIGPSTCPEYLEFFKCLFSLCGVFWSVRLLVQDNSGRSWIFAEEHWKQQCSTEQRIVQSLT